MCVWGDLAPGLWISDFSDGLEVTALFGWETGRDGKARFWHGQLWEGKKRKWEISGFRPAGRDWVAVCVISRMMNDDGMKRATFSLS